MAGLLTTPWQPANLDFIDADASMAARLALQAQGQQQDMATRLAQAAAQQAQHERESVLAQQKMQQEADYRAAEEDRLNHALGLKEAHDAAQETRLNTDEARKDRLTSAQIGWYGRRGTGTGRPAATPLQPVPELPVGGAATPAPAAKDGGSNPGVNLYNSVTGGGPILGRITDYQRDEKGGDANTRAGLSAIGRLRPDSMAFSPDLERLAAQHGVKIGSDAAVTLDDGTTIVKHFDDRTSPALTGRVDLFTDGAPSPFRDRKVLSIDPVDPAPNSPSAKGVAALAPAPASPAPPPPALSLQDFQMPPAVVDQPVAPPVDAAAQLAAIGQPPASMAEQLSALVGPDGAARVNAVSALERKGIARPGSSAAALQQELAQSRRVEGKGVGTPKMQMKIAQDGTPYAFNPTTGESHPVDVPEGTRFGHAPSALHVRSTFQDAEGNRYVQMADGTWKDDKEPPEGVNISRIGSGGAGAVTAPHLNAQLTQADREEKYAQAELDKIAKAHPKPEDQTVGYPWKEDDGKMYRQDGEDRRQPVKNKAEYDRLIEEASNIERHKAVIQSARARADSLRAQIEGRPAATPAPAAERPAPAPVATAPAAAPAPALTATPAATGQYASPGDVKAAYKAGKLSKEDASKILREQFRM